MTSYTLHINLFDLLSLTAVLVGLTFALQLWLKNSVHRSANRLLASALAVMVVWMAGKLLTDLGKAAPPCQFLLAFGPFLYFYVRKLLHPDSRFKRKDLLHFCPVVLELFLGIYGISSWVQPLALASTGVYLHLSHRLIGNYYMRLKFTEGDRNLDEWRWLQKLLVSLGIVVILSVPYILSGFYFRFSGQVYYSLYLMLAAVVIRMGVVVFFRSPTIAPVDESQFSRTPPSAALKQKGAWLKKTIAERFLYQDAELSVSTLAAQLDIPAHELSRIINTSLKKNFSDFINEYRINDIIRKMQDPDYDRMTLEGIAFTSGFNSKTTFNRTFRQMTGRSPAEYKNLLKNQRPFSKTGVYTANRLVALHHETALERLHIKGNPIAMFRNYIKIAFRNLIRDRAYSVLNLLGLSVGLASVIMIMAYVRYELSYDKSYSNHDRVYRIISESKTGNTDDFSLATPAGLAQALKKEFPAIATFSFVGKYEVDFKEGNELVKLNTLYGSVDFFKLFNFDFIGGDANTALRDPNTVVITESIARRFFKGKNPIGRSLINVYDKTYQVTGVIKDIPANSHLKGDIILSESYAKEVLNWKAYISVPQYILLDKHADAKKLEAQFSSIYHKYQFPPNTTLHLQAVTDVHLKSHLDSELSANSDIKYVYIFLSAALLILFIACVNYINLTTARSLQRAKEIGLRKVLGAAKKQLVTQFLTESFLFCLLSTIVALVIAIIAWPGFSNKITSYGNLIPLFDSSSIFIIGAIFIVAGLFAGAYPAFFLSSLQPVKILRGLSKFGFNVSIRKALVVLQFVISGVLIISTIVVYRQLGFISDARLGFNKDNLLTIPYQVKNPQWKAFKNELIKDNAVKNVTAAGWTIGLHYGGSSSMNDEKDTTKLLKFDFLQTDLDFLKTLEIKIIAGRPFSAEHSNDTLNLAPLFKMKLPYEKFQREVAKKSIILNQEAASLLGITKTDTTITTGAVQGTVIGIAENFNGLTLHQKIPAIIIECNAEYAFGQLFIRVSPKNTSKTIAYIQGVWKKFYPGKRFDFAFADDKLQELYTADRRLGTIFATFASLAIIIGCLGLFGLVSLTVQNRIKEIGIRKVLGASVFSITSLVSADFIKLVILSLIISSPLAWYIMNKWLEDFAYRVNIQWWVFALTGCLSVIIALATLSFQSVKAAMANPVDSLRNE